MNPASGQLAIDNLRTRCSRAPCQAIISATLRRGPRTRLPPGSRRPHRQRHPRTTERRTRRRTPEAPPPPRRRRRKRAAAASGAAASAAGQQRRAGRRAQHRRAEGHEHSEAHADRQGAERRRRDRHAQAGADLPDPEGADRAERLHLLGRRARGAAGRLRLPARARLQLSARPGRHLRLAVADSQVRPADRRHGLRADSSAEGRRALLRAHQGRGGQLRGARAGARQAVLRKPHAAVPAGAARSSRRRTRICRRASWICGRRSARGSAA